MSASLVGTSVIRKEGRAKVTGTARYIDDIIFPGMIYGATFRSPVARGRLQNIRFEQTVNWNEYVVVSAKDIPGKNCVALIVDDQPYLVDREIQHCEEPILLIAHEDKYALERAKKAIRADIEKLPPVLSMEESTTVLKSYLMEKGDVDSVWKRDDVLIVEGEYATGAQEQLYIENNGMIAVVESDESKKPVSVTVWGSMQCPYYVQKALMSLFGLPAEKTRVIQVETGGGFGGKEEYPSVLAGHAALLAWKSGRPVKMIYDRAEDMLATTKRHPSRTKHRTAVTKDGTLVAMDIDFVIDGGAYATLSAVVLSRGTIHAAGPYHCPNVRVKSKAVATNTPPNGAFRGFGAPQSIFALERHLQYVAKAVGLTPEELRRRNLLKMNQTTATGQKIHEKIRLEELLDKALKATNFHQKQKEFREQNSKSVIKKGIGLSMFMHGAGFTGSGEKYLASVVGLEATAEGKVRVLAASTEIGQGTNTIFSQMAADALGLSYDDIEVAQPDTAHVPNSGPTVASRTCMIVGGLVMSAAQALKQTLRTSGFLKEKYTREEFSAACQAYVSKLGPLKCFTQYEPPRGVEWDDKAYRGDAYAAFAWAVYIAEVSVDTLTYQTKVDRFYALQEVGKVVNPVLATGQIEGGVAQGIGYSLYEKVVWNQGRMANHQMSNYIMPTSVDVPEIIVHFEEEPFAGAEAVTKGIGELPMDGPGPAIANALDDALGIRANHIPFMPEDVMEAMHS